jgi:hypothetical protein
MLNQVLDLVVVLVLTGHTVMLLTQMVVLDRVDLVVLSSVGERLDLQLPINK